MFDDAPFAERETAAECAANTEGDPEHIPAKTELPDFLELLQGVR